MDNKRRRSGCTTVIATLGLGLFVCGGTYLFLASPAFPGYSTWDYLLYLAQHYGVTTPDVTISVLNNPFTITALKVVVVFLLAVTIMRFIQWPIIKFFDKRMIGRIEKDVSAASEISWLSRFMDRIVPEGGAKDVPILPSGIYETGPGEVFIDLFWPDWWWKTIYSRVVKRTALLLIVVWLVTSVASLSAYATESAVASWTVFWALLLEFVLVAWVYISSEWLRSNNIIFVFSNNFLHSQAEGTIPGAITGKGADIHVDITDSQLPREKSIAVKPSDLPVGLAPEKPVPWYDEWVLEFLARVRGMRILAMLSFYEDAADVWESFARFNRISQAMSRAVNVRGETQSYISIVVNKAANMMAAPENPSAPWSYSEGKSNAQAYIARSLAPLAPPKLVNLLALKWEALGRPVDGATSGGIIAGEIPSLPSTARGEFHVQADETPEVERATSQPEQPVQPARPVHSKPERTEPANPHKITRRRT